MRLPVDPDVGPCFYCGVRTDVSCRHRAARAMPEQPVLACDEVKLDRRQFHNAWARRTRDGEKCATELAEKLKAMLAVRRT